VQVWRRTLAQVGAGLSATWRTDFADPVEMAGLRARALGVSALLGIGADLSTLAAAPHLSLRGWVAQGVVLTYLLLLVVWSRRGRRIGDREFLIMIVATYAYAAACVALSIGGGQVAITALSIASIGLVGALFCGPRTHVVVQTLVGIGTLLVAERVGPHTQLTAMATSTGAFDLIVASLVVRVLKDLAIASVARSRQGEVTDPLTGLLNRRGLERQGTQRWVARAALDLPLAVLVIDVDHFKQINDSQGHAAGDEALRRLALVITAASRSEDLAVRLGGEEFLVLAGVDAGEGQLAGERLREAIEAQLYPLTVSVGTHELLPDSRADLPESLWAAVDAADRALYLAKTTGRNRVVATTPQQAPSAGYR